MRYLRTQVINRRAPFDTRLNVDVTDSIIMNTTNHLLLPKGTGGYRPSDSTGRPVDPVVGMMRYNTDTNEVEVYQGRADNTETTATWRSLRFKESVPIIQQDLGFGTLGGETFFGPLNPAPPTKVDSNIAWASNGVGNADTPGDLWTGANLIVLVENVIQIFNINYTIAQNPPGKSAGYYISFDSAVPYSKRVTVLHGFDR